MGIHPKVINVVTIGVVIVTGLNLSVLFIGGTLPNLNSFGHNDSSTGTLEIEWLSPTHPAIDMGKYFMPSEDNIELSSSIVSSGTDIVHMGLTSNE